MNELMNRVKEKLERESEEKGLDRKATAILPAVRETLLKFSEQESEFAQAIAESGKTLKECCEHIVKDTGNSISDIEVYRRAVKFYFDGADVEFEMRINLCASVDAPAKIMRLSILDLM